MMIVVRFIVLLAVVLVVAAPAAATDPAPIPYPGPGVRLALARLFFEAQTASYPATAAVVSIESDLPLHRTRVLLRRRRDDGQVRKVDDAWELTHRGWNWVLLSKP